MYFNVEFLPVTGAKINNEQVTSGCHGLTDFLGTPREDMTCKMLQINSSVSMKENELHWLRVSTIYFSLNESEKSGMMCHL